MGCMHGKRMISKYISYEINHSNKKKKKKIKPSFSKLPTLLQEEIRMTCYEDLKYLMSERILEFK